ncbi:DsbC family protein [Halothiobacillus sp. DCM-1]|uniref:DsbC family protein n=1 Tax=Halothiobacillus sp. DCM-1 TaxID=3112558 RepID=UPI003250E9B3
MTAQTLTLALACSMAAVPVVLADAAADEQAIRSSLAQNMPDLPIQSVTPTPVKGLYQVISGGQIAYVTADGQFLLAGSLLDLKNHVNLTEQVRDKQRLELLKTVPASHKIIFPATGAKKGSLTILTDPTCPFCEKLHREVPALQAAGIEVQAILTPRAGAGSPGYVESSQVMCSKQPAAMLDQAMARKPLSGDACQNKLVEDNMALAEQLGMSGTPYIILPDGSAVPGYRPAAMLIPIVTGQTAGK